MALARAILSDKADDKCKVTYTQKQTGLVHIYLELTADLNSSSSVANDMGQTQVLSCFVMWAIFLQSLHELE